MSLSNAAQNRLVTLKPGTYWRVEPRDFTQHADLRLTEPTNALLIEFQGRHGGNRNENDECWHALVDGEVILVWGSSFNDSSKAG